jgi:hypothetical protein
VWTYGLIVAYLDGTVDDYVLGRGTEVACEAAAQALEAVDVKGIPMIEIPLLDGKVAISATVYVRRTEPDE